MAKWKATKTHTPFSSWLHSPWQSMHLWKFQMACVCLKAWEGSWRAASILSPRAVQGGCTADQFQQDIYMRSSASFKKPLLLQAWLLPGRTGELFIAIADRHLSGQRNLEASNTSLLAFSPGLSRRCAFQEWDGWADGWFADRLKILPRAQKAGWLLFIPLPQMTMLNRETLNSIVITTGYLIVEIFWWFCLRTWSPIFSHRLLSDCGSSISSSFLLILASAFST